MHKLDVITEARELKTQLAYAKNIGFFLGAGTSCALKVPDIAALTSQVEQTITGDALKHFCAIRDDLKSTNEIVNIEDILNQIRRIREITSEQKEKAFLNVTGEAAKLLDKSLCQSICDIITKSEEQADLTIPCRFFAWLDLMNRECSKEVFTTNYDLIIERALESSQIPYFDGFVGAYEPFFWQESVDQRIGRTDITQNWIRVWKLHGSLSWFWKEDAKMHSQRIIRVGRFDRANRNEAELVIYPSKEKYESSRKQPFVAYFDHLRNYLLSGELVFIFTGYSFSDQHINDVIFNCLRQNKRLFCVVFFYKDEEVEALHHSASAYMNLNVFGPTKAIVNGALHAWDFDVATKKENEAVDKYYDEAKQRFKLGDFEHLVAFLVSSSGKTELFEHGAA